MFCDACGRPIDDGLEYCNHCGAKANNSGVTKIPSVRNKVFAYIGLGFGIASLVSSLIPYVSYLFYFNAIPAFVFSNYGFDSTKKHIAKRARILAILSVIFGIIVSVLTIIWNDLQSHRY